MRDKTSIVGGNETILLAEDEDAIRITTQFFLEDIGYKMLVASTSEEALLKAEEHTGQIHLLLSDVNLPDMSGPDLAKKLSETSQDIKKLFMSGYTASIIADDHDADMNFLSKPFTHDTLAAKIREVIDIA
ncbi:MAG: response regulator [Kiritimatiellae bacterium]|nr:response regulator [Kiritimatiellia bacterium]